MKRDANRIDNSQINMPMPGFRGGRGGGPGGRFMRPVEKPKDAGKTLRRLAVFFKGQYFAIFCSFLLVIATSLSALAGPYLLGRAIDTLDTGSPVNILRQIILGLAGIYLADAVARFLQNWMMAGVSQKIVRLMRQNLFAKLQKLPLSFFDSYTHGELMSRLANDTDNIAGVLGNAITQIMSILIVLTGTFAMMLYLSPTMTFFSVLTMPLVYLLTKTISKATRKLFAQQQAALGSLNSHIEENITGIAVVKAYSHEKYVVDEFEKINEQLREVATKAHILSGYIMPIMNVINNLGFTVVAAAGGILAVRGSISIGVIASFINYSRQFSRPLNELANTYNNFQSALAGAERVFAILDSEQEPEDVPGAKEMRNVRGKVEFKNVSFEYVQGEPVLKNVSFHVEPGSTIALVGPTGAGKTTIVNLINRFYDIQEGNIIIDGEDIRNYKRDSLRKAFGIVLQDTYLFTGTIKENIAYGNPNAGLDEIKAAAKAAGADTFIKRLPEGYNTLLSESGQNLSHGQRQLIAIARAILYNPSILILDEATSSVDTRTELKIQEAMVKLMKGRTSFIIAHRLSTVVGADMIMLIDHGKLEEWGNHDELIKKDGAYARMFNMQSQGVSIDNTGRKYG